MCVKNHFNCLLLILLFVCNNTFAQTGTTTPAPATSAPTASATTPKAATSATPVAAPAPAANGAPGTATAAPRPAPRPRPAAAPVTPTPETVGPVWKKQITRDINLGEKVDSNVHRLRDASPNNTLLEMLAIGIKTGKVSSFYTSDFSLATRIRVSDFSKLFVGQPDTIAVRDATGKYVPKIVRKDFNYSSVHKYRVLEEWTSYPAMGKTEIQIVGIAPLKDIPNADGTLQGVEPIFWVHYTEDIKTLLTRYDQYHPNSTLGGRLWDDYFISNAAQK